MLRGLESSGELGESERMVHSHDRRNVSLGLDRACREAPERDGGFLRESMSTMALHDISVATGGLVLEVQGDEEKE